MAKKIKKVIFLRNVQNIWRRMSGRRNFREANTISPSAGFGIIEVIVSMSIIILVLIGFSSAVSLSMRAHTSREYTATASEIAGEGIQWVISKRNNNQACLQNACGSVSFWYENLLPGGPWEIDATKTGELSPGVSFDAFNPSHYLCIKGGRYGYAPGCDEAVLHNYTRKIEVAQIDAHRIQVKVTVEWGASGSRKDLTREVILFE